MGQELACRLHWAGRVIDGKAYLETDCLLFRGAERVKVPLQELTSVTASDGILHLGFPGGPAGLELGTAAEKWADRILHPPSRASKLGIRPGLRIRIAGGFDTDFLDEIHRQGAAVETGRGKVDVVFFAAQKSSGLSRVRALAAGIVPAGAVWVVYPKGVPQIREVEVIAAGRAAGLKDVKVASFSAVQTALKFVFPLSKR